MQDAPKAVWSIPYVPVAFLPSLKKNFIVYRSSKVSSRPDCIFAIHQRWQSGLSRVYSNCCCSCSFEPEIINQSSHKIYSNNILNFQESTTILNACTKKSLETYWRYHVSRNLKNFEFADWLINAKIRIQNFSFTSLFFAQNLTHFFFSMEISWVPPCVCVCDDIYVFTNPSAWEECETRSIFKQSLTGAKLEFSFSYTCCHINVKNHSLPYYLPIVGKRIVRCIPFTIALVKCEYPRPGFELPSLCQFSSDDDHERLLIYISDEGWLGNLFMQSIM